MLKLWASFVAALVLSVAPAAYAAADCRMVKVTELPVRFVRNEPQVQLTINGKPAWFLIDTGAASSLMWGGVAKQLGVGLRTAQGTYGEQLQVYGAGGGGDLEYAVIGSFEMPGVKLKNVGMYAIGRGRGSLEDAGLLGRDLLSNWDLEFDLAAKALRLWAPQNCGARSLAYWSKDADFADLIVEEKAGPYLVALQINKKRVMAELDSGAGVSVMTDDLARRVGVPQANYVAKGESQGIAERKFGVRLARLDEVVIGDEQVKHPTVQVADLFGADRETTTGTLVAHAVDIHMPDMLLGADFLRSHRVLFAPEQRRLYFTYGGGPIFDVVGDPVASTPPTATPSAAPTAPPAAGGPPADAAHPPAASSAAPH